MTKIKKTFFSKELVDKNRDSQDLSNEKPNLGSSKLVGNDKLQTLEMTDHNNEGHGHHPKKRNFLEEVWFQLK